MMDNDNSLHKRPTFKRALRNISMTSIFITMMLIWLLLSVTSVLTLKQYAQKNLALTAATMTYTLEAAVVFADGPAATEHWQRWGSKANLQLQKCVISSKIFWHPGITPVRIQAILSAIS